MGNKYHNHCSTTKYLLSENTSSLLGWPPLENTGCDGNRIFQLNISIAFACSDPRMWNRYYTQDPNGFPCHFPDSKVLCNWKQESLLCTLHISQATNYTGGFHHRSKNPWKAKDGTGRKQNKEKKLWYGVFICSVFCFCSEKEGEAICRKKIFLKNGYPDNDLIFKRKTKNMKRIWKRPFYNEIKK